MFQKSRQNEQVYGEKFLSYPAPSTQFSPEPPHR